MTDLKSFDSPHSNPESGSMWWATLTDQEKQSKIRDVRFIGPDIKQKIDAQNMGIVTEEHSSISGDEIETVRREYYSISPQQDSLSPRDNVRTDMTSSGILRELNIRKGLSGEQTQSFLFTGLSDTDPFVFRATDHQQSMQVRYDSNGFLRTLNTHEQGEVEDSPLKERLGITVKPEDLVQLREGHKITNDKYSVVSDRENQNIDIVKKVKANELPVSMRYGAEGEEEVDVLVLTVPAHFDFKDYKKEVFPPDIFADFFTPDFKDDMNWRDKDIIAIAGIHFAPISQLEIKRMGNLLSSLDQQDDFDEEPSGH